MVETRIVNGWHVPAWDRVFQSCLARGEWEKDIIAAAIKWDERRLIAVDGGAHIGCITKQLAPHYQSVIAWEPFEENYACLLMNLPDAICIKAALGDIIGESWMVRGHQNSGQAHLSGSGEVVKVMPLDTAPLRGDLTFLKLDVEGMELQALAGAEETICRSKPVILLELNGLGKRYGHSDEDVRDWLRRHGYGRAMVLRADNEVWIPE